MPPTLGPDPVRCKRCDGVLPTGEVGWNRARLCPACRAAELARHALTHRDEDEEE